jgi:hypothetical protein
MYDEDLTNLEDWLRRLKVEFDIFFNGHRKKPPDDLKMKLERLLKKLGEAGDMSFQERFRYNTIVARYYIYKDLWRRTLLGREEGKTGCFRPHDSQDAAPGASAQPPARECRVSIADPEAEPERVKELYQGLLALRKEGPAGAPPLPLDRFARYISEQTRELRAKYACNRVIFTVALDDAAVRFRARPDSSRDETSG